MGFEALGEFSDMPGVSGPVAPAAATLPLVAPAMPTKTEWAMGTAQKLVFPALLGGVAGYFIYGWIGAILGAITLSAGYYFVSAWVMAQALGAAFRTG